MRDASAQQKKGRKGKARTYERQVGEQQHANEQAKLAQHSHLEVL